MTRRPKEEDYDTYEEYLEAVEAYEWYISDETEEYVEQQQRDNYERV